jgi:neutral ceramidase
VDLIERGHSPDVGTPERASAGVLSRAAFSKVEISACTVGSQLVGFGDDERIAVAENDPLFVRALVLESGRGRVALCSVDLCNVGEDIVERARIELERRGIVPATRVFIAATHTHSGPDDGDERCWPAGLEQHIVAAVVDASERLVPARVGAGWGGVHGVGVNRRRIEDPVDPALLVLRVDDLEGRALGVVYGFGCHPNILGLEHRVVSAEWPGVCSQMLESQLGAGTTAMFLLGATGDVNPLTDAERRRLAAGRVVMTTARLHYYGPNKPSIDTIRSGAGGDRAAVERLAATVAEEARRVYDGVEVGEIGELWADEVVVNQGVDRSSLRLSEIDRIYMLGPSAPRVTPGTPFHVMLLGIDGPGVVLVGQPGEVFASTGAEFRRHLRGAGALHPFVVACANGRRGYLPPSDAWADGGYEVERARAMGIAPTIQEEILASVSTRIEQRHAEAGGLG